MFWIRPWKSHSTRPPSFSRIVYPHNGNLPGRTFNSCRRHFSRPPCREGVLATVARLAHFQGCWGSFFRVLQPHHQSGQRKHPSSRRQRMSICTTQYRSTQLAGCTAEPDHPRALLHDAEGHPEHSKYLERPVHGPICQHGRLQHLLRCAQGAGRSNFIHFDSFRRPLAGAAPKSHSRFGDGMLHDALRVLGHSC